MEETGVDKVFLIGGSAGSLDIILNLAESIPPATKSIFVIIVHRKPGPDSILLNLISTRTGITAREVEDKEPVIPGTIYLAPPGYHLLFENENMFSLDGSEKLHFSRPSIDITFESAAEIFGDKVIGILLSGANADGADGMCAIKQFSGVTIAQNPDSAEVGYMPRQAIEKNCAELVLDPNEIADYINNRS